MLRFPTVLCFLFILALFSCGGENNGTPTTRSEPRVQNSSDDSTALVSVKVYQSDRSIQCEEGGVALNVMQAELVDHGVDVICAQSGHDGLARMAMCGVSTGKINVFTIYQSNLADAIALGYEETNRLEHYQDAQCVPN